MGEAEDAAAAFQPFLEQYLAEVPGGAAGDRKIRERITTPFMDITAEDVRLDSLTDEQIDGWQQYAAWNLWELIANRSTEGESGLIPRQEYETCAFVQHWSVYPRIMRTITEAIGVDGVIELGRTAHREVGTKLNVTRNWATPMVAMLGRGIVAKLGLEEPGARREDLEEVIKFARRLQFGTWGEGCGFVSGRGFVSPALDADVLARLAVDLDPLADPDVRKAFRRFNGATELFGFLLHYDNRAAMCDTGPYPQEDGGFIIVRDHILHERAYEWGACAEGLPYAVTEILSFKPGTDPLEVTINDISTTFTKPADYLKHLDAVAVYARDEQETPMEGLRRLGPDEQLAIAKQCSTTMLSLYQTIADKDRDQKIKDGVQVYAYEMIMPIAQRAGVWDDVKPQVDELSELTLQAWPTLCGGGAAEVLPPVFLLGEGFPLLSKVSS
ncbi:hypothetical protein [Patulibacter minatonensis]|uniref:hypothetical protein n=1 Tax=Patulibacter minatonensis TaxID=298163 RepID=UPI000687941B|nr:hypothetical protein [Patulibacter minatonensis]